MNNYQTSNFLAGRVFANFRKLFALLLFSSLLLLFSSCASDYEEFRGQYTELRFLSIK